jgi:hypothetical protein
MKIPILIKIICLLGLCWLFAFYSCSNRRQVEDTSSSPEPELRRLKMDISYLKEETQSKQIACEKENCIELIFDDYEEIDEKLHSLMEQNAGKILIKMRYYNKKVGDEELSSIVSYIREITKRNGKVSIEPYYIGERGIVSHIPVLKDVGMRGWDIYTRVRNAIRYKKTENYNAKILYHPRLYNVMMIFFVHKNYGNVCDTIYSACRVIEYLNDDTFDASLSTAIQEAQETNQPIKVSFNQVPAKLPEFKIDLAALKQISQSARLYKWFIAAKETKKKKIVQERFLGVTTVISIIDYSMTAYDLVQQYVLYKPAFKTIAEVSYSGEEKGGNIESVVFVPYM